MEGRLKTRDTDFCVEKLRSEFAVLKQTYREQPLIYLDNAATMQMPDAVKRRIVQHYERDNGNVHRGIHFLSARTTEAYENARTLIAEQLGAKNRDQLIFTAGTTDAINQVCSMTAPFLMPGDEIMVTQMEHHSNFLPWMQLAKQSQAKLVVIPVLEDGKLDLEQFYRKMSPRTKIAAFTQLSNVTGVKNPVEKMSSYIRNHTDALILVDGAQGIVHMGYGMPDCDFYCFSGHKLGALTGIGVLCMSERAQKICRPTRFGGGTVYQVSETEMLLKDGAERFEAGTPNYAGAVSLAEACMFWKQYPGRAVREHETRLLTVLEQELCNIPSVRILSEGQEKTGCLSFVSSVAGAYDLCTHFNRYGLAVRSGHHCAQPYLNALGIQSAVRVSVAPYNTMAEIQRAAEIIRETITYFERILANGPHEHGRGRRRYKK